MRCRWKRPTNHPPLETAQGQRRCPCGSTYCTHTFACSRHALSWFAGCVGERESVPREATKTTHIPRDIRKIMIPHSAKKSRRAHRRTRRAKSTQSRAAKVELKPQVVRRASRASRSPRSARATSGRRCCARGGTMLIRARNAAL